MLHEGGITPSTFNKRKLKKYTRGRKHSKSDSKAMFLKHPERLPSWSMVVCNCTPGDCPRPCLLTEGVQSLDLNLVSPASKREVKRVGIDFK